MKETKFINQNKEKWAETEAMLKTVHKDPDQLNASFVQVTNDLSYARTFYPNRSVRVYLNNLARHFLGDLFSDRRSPKNWFINFWKEQYPQVVIACRKELLLALAIMLVCIGIGAFSSAHDPSFPAQILGGGYVKMTEDNIAKGDPMAVYKESPPFEMFFQITFNNIRVAFIGFVLGLLACFGSIIFLIVNGIMIGAFQYFFYSKGLTTESMLAIWLHGTIEISSIVVACAAGIKLGSGLLLPGTYNRLQSFQVSASMGARLLFGTAPLLLIAGFIESYLTRFTEAPVLIRVLLIFASLLLILTLYVIYPYLRARNGFRQPLQVPRIQPDQPLKPVTGVIAGNDEIAGNAFRFFRSCMGYSLLLAACAGTIIGFADLLLEGEHIVQRISNLDVFYYIGKLFVVFDISSVSQALVYAGTFALFAMLLFRRFNRSAGIATPKGVMDVLAVYLQLFMVFLPGMLLFWWGNGLVVFLSVLFYLFAFVWAYSVYNGRNLFSALGHAGTLVSGAFGGYMGQQAIVLLLTFVFTGILNSPLIYQYWSYLQWFMSTDNTILSKVLPFVSDLISKVIFFFILSFSFIGAAMLYHSMEEVHSASALMGKISRLGSDKVKRGLEYEK